MQQFAIRTAVAQATAECQMKINLLVSPNQYDANYETSLHVAEPQGISK